MKMLIGTAVFGLLAIPATLACDGHECRMEPPRRVSPMYSLRLIAAVTGVALCSVSFSTCTAEGFEDMTTRKSMLRLAQERPFGGPLPPQRRSIGKKPSGTACKTPAITCKLQDAQPVGDACSCPGSDGKPATGTVVEQPS